MVLSKPEASGITGERGVADKVRNARHTKSPRRDGGDEGGVFAAA